MTLVRLFHSLKFRIVAVSVLAAVLAALGAASLVVSATQGELQRLLLDDDRQDRERIAALLAGKLETLKHSLATVARRTTPAHWRDPEAMQRFLLDAPGLEALFDTVVAVAPDGRTVTSLEGGRASTVPMRIGDRPYVQQALQTDQPVVSVPMMGRVTRAPLIGMAVSAFDTDGTRTGVLACGLRLQSNSLFADPLAARTDGVRELVMDRSGVLLSHTDTARVLGRAEDEPGFQAVFKRWAESGRPIDTVGIAELSDGHLVSMAGIPLSDWVLVRLTPQASALAPLAAAQRTAWAAALAAGLGAALLAGAVAWAAVRPIERLRDRAGRMLAEGGAALEGWPRGEGEIGQMSRAFQQLLQQNAVQRDQAQALLSRLQAVLDNADVGIALTRNGRFEMVSRQFCAIFRCEAADLVGQPTRMIHASEAAHDALAQQVQPAFAEQGLFDGEVELMRRGGELFWAHLRGRAVVSGHRARGTIWVVADVTAARQQRELLTWAASHDALTGLANRAAFEVLLEDATARAGEQPFCALFLDLDRFKDVNDSGGHAAGDALLRDVAGALAARLRKSDTIARLGGDEFAVLLPQCSLAQARVIADKLRLAVEDYRLDWEGQLHSVGASIGLVQVDGSIDSAADVLRAADAACYQAKRQGRNRVAVAGV